MKHWLSHASPTRRPSRSTWVLLHLLATVLVLALASCGGSGGGGNGGGSTVTVSISPSTATVSTGGAVSFTATVSGTSNTAVTWTTSGGSITPAGVLTAPATAGTVTVTATSVADTSAKATATVTVGSTSGTPTITITPSNPVVTPGSTIDFTATLSNGTGTIVWEASQGKIDSSTGVYTAPNKVTTDTVTARLSGNSSVFTRISVAVSNEGPTITITPSVATLGTNEKTKFTATVGNTSNTGVTWSATGGFISSDGTFTAGSTPGTYVVTAASTQDPSRIATAKVTVNAITVSVTPNPVTLAVGQSQTFSARVVGANYSGVTWSASTGTINSSTGAYVAPLTATTATITATSIADPSAKGTSTVTVQSSSSFSYDFESGTPAVWNPTNNATTPVGNRHFLGRQSGTTPVTLTLSSLTAHTSVNVEFDLYVIGAWDGSATNGQFQVNLGSTNVFSQTFSNITGANQSYPDSGTHLPGYSSTEQNTLGYTHDPSILYNDTVYHVKLTNLAHSSSSATLTFLAGLTGDVTDKSWGIDNVKVSANP